MRLLSPRPPPLDGLSSPPSPAWSCTRSRSAGSATQEHLSPPTPGSCYFPAPTIVDTDEFTLQFDVQFDKMAAGSPHKSSIAHPLLRPSVSSPKTDPFLLSEDDMNNNPWESMCDRFESSPPLRCPDAPCIQPVSPDGASDTFSLEATHSAFVDLSELPDSSRYSLLIHEVSLLVGLTADNDHLSLSDCCPLVRDGSEQLPNVLPLSFTPTKSLASRKPKNASLPGPTNTNGQVHPPGVLASSSTRSRANNADASLHNEDPPPVRSKGLVTPIARHKNADAAAPFLSPRRRQGQVFQFEPSLSDAYHRNAVDLDETFFHPREPPQNSTLEPPANRCSSLDRLEYSLRKLQAHAPGNHRKSQSEGRSPDHVIQRKDKRPSLPSPRHLKKQRSVHETMRCNPPRPAVDCHFSGPPPASRPIPFHQYVEPPTSPEAPLDNKHREVDHTPGSFMDMDVPPSEEASQKRQVSFRRATSKHKLKSLINVTRRMSRGVIAWGKNLTGSTSPSIEGKGMNAVKSARV